MPQLHPSTRTRRRLLVTGLLTAVAVLGTPAIASAEAPSLPGVPDLGGLDPSTLGELGTEGTDTGGADTGGGAPAAGGAPSAEEVQDAVTAFPECLTDAGAQIQVAIEDLGTDLTAGFASLAENQSALTDLLADPSGVLTGDITLDPEDLQELIASGQTSVTMIVTAVVDGVRQIVQVVVDLGECLADLAPAAAPSSSAAASPPAAAAPPSVAAPAAAAPVAYPGYAPTGGAPTEDGSPLALAGLGLLTAAAGGGAFWLRGRRGVIG